MKRLVLIFIFLILTTATVAAEEEMIPRPWAEGRDSLIPDSAMKKGGLDTSLIPIAYDDNEWYVTTPDKVLYQPKMVKEIRDGMVVWVAKGFRGVRYHPINLTKDNKPIWLKIENVWNLPNPGTVRAGIDYTNPDGPCIFTP